MIKDMSPGPMDQYLVGIVKSIKEGLTKNGDPFINMEVADRTGTIEVKIWNTAEDDLAERKVRSGTFIYAKGRVGEFNDRVQFTIENNGNPNIANLDDYPDLKSKYDLKDYIPMAPVSYEEIGEYFDWAIGQVKDYEIRGFLQGVMNDYGHDLISYPASVGVHHEYVNGLGYHVYRMLKSAFALYEVYGSSLDMDYLIAGVLTHDLGKIRCYVLNDVGLPEGYTLENDLHGHIALGYKMVEEYDFSREKKDMVQHLILSHHGTREFGAAALPMTLEAQLLHYIDNIDAKATIVEREMEVLEDYEVSKRIWSLDNNKLYKMPKEKPDSSLGLED